MKLLAGLTFTLSITILSLGCTETVGQSQTPQNQMLGPLQAPVTIPQAPKVLDEEDQQRSATEAALETMSVYCNEASCPESIGMLGTITRVQPSDALALGRCTAFLVSPNTIATNAHCIPVSVLLAPQTCGQNIGFYLPPMGSKPEHRVRCKRVLFQQRGASPASMNSTEDIAFLELERSIDDRTPYTLSSEGIPDSYGSIGEGNHTAYKIVSIDPQGVNSGQFHTRVCGAISNVILVTPNTPTSVVRVMAPCNVNPGNSGSPVFNGSGQPVAILFAGNSSYQELTGLPEAFAQLDEVGVVHPPIREIENLTMATSFRCLSHNIDGTARTAPADCFLSEENLRFDRSLQNAPTQAERRRILSESMVQEFRSKWRGYLPDFLELRRSMPQPFHWKFHYIPSTLGYSGSIYMVPACIKPQNQWLSTFQNQTGIVEHPLSLVIHNLAVTINTRLQILLGMMPIGRLATKVIFSAQEIQNSSGTGRVRIIADDVLTLSRAGFFSFESPIMSHVIQTLPTTALTGNYVAELFNQELAPCTQEQLNDDLMIEVDATRVRGADPFNDRVTQ